MWLPMTFRPDARESRLTDSHVVVGEVLLMSEEAQAAITDSMPAVTTKWRMRQVCGGLAWKGETRPEGDPEALEEDEYGRWSVAVPVKRSGGKFSAETPAPISSSSSHARFPQL
jgi:hypothetical protein